MTTADPTIEHLNVTITSDHFENYSEISESLYKLNPAYTFFEILVAICAIVGNVMVIIVFNKERRLRRRTNYYIVSLATADFLVGLFGIPFAILTSVGLPTNLYACLFTITTLVVLCTISIFCLVAVSVDRYWAILHPMAYSRNVRTKTAILIISMCWLAGSVVGFLPLFGWHKGSKTNQDCLFVEVMDYDYLVFLYFATIITPALVLAAFYAHIYRVIIRQLRQIVTMNPLSDRGSRRGGSVTSQRPAGGTMLRVLGAAQKREVKATQNLSIIVLFFMICWVPLYTINCVKAFCPDCDVHPKLTLFCIILSHLNSAVNPLLYAYHLRDFRAALKSLILGLFGIVEHRPHDLNRFPSLAKCNQRERVQTSLKDKRPSLQPRIYVDSPIWLRTRAAELAAQGRSTGISCSLNNINQTVTAIGTRDHDIWKISEVPSFAEEGSKESGARGSIGTKPRRSSSADNCIGNQLNAAFIDEVYMDYDEDDDEVFMPPTPSVSRSDFGDTLFSTVLPFSTCDRNESIASLNVPIQPMSEPSQSSLPGLGLFLIDDITTTDITKLAITEKTPKILRNGKPSIPLPSDIECKNSPLRSVSDFFLQPSIKQYLHYQRNGSTKHAKS